MYTFNIKQKKSCLDELQRLKRKEYAYHEIRIQNLHIKNMDFLIGRKIFGKNELYVNPRTLWADMQKGNGERPHHFHNLDIYDIYNALNNLRNPNAIYKSNFFTNRYVVATDALFQNKIPIIVIIEVGAPLVNRSDANINKIITIYPKDKISTKNNTLIYKR